MLWRTKHTRVHNLVRKHKPGEVVYTVVTAVRSAEAKRILKQTWAAQTNIKQSQNKIHTQPSHLVDFRMFAKKNSDSKICSTKTQRDTAIYAR